MHPLGMGRGESQLVFEVPTAEVVWHQSRGDFDTLLASDAAHLQSLGEPLWQSYVS